MKKNIFLILISISIMVLLIGCGTSSKKTKTTELTNKDIAGCWETEMSGYKIRVYYYEDGTFSQNGEDIQGSYTLEDGKITKTLYKVNIPKTYSIELSGDTLIEDGDEYKRVE